jgi:hypothetical protein
VDIANGYKAPRAAIKKLEAAMAYGHSHFNFNGLSVKFRLLTFNSI